MDENQKKSKSDDKELRAIVISVLFLVLGLAVAWIIKDFVNIDIEKGEAIYVALLLIPILVYMILSDRLQELKGPGGWEMKFAKVAATKIDLEKIEAYIDDPDVIRKGAVTELKGIMLRLKELPVDRPIILTAYLGLGGYTREASLQYIRALNQFRNFKLVVFLRDSKYEANMSADSVEKLLSDKQLGEEFIKAINEGQLERLFDYPDVVRDFISVKASNAEALRQMERLSLDALVVVDESRHLKSVIERDKLINKMILEALTPT